MLDDAGASATVGLVAGSLVGMAATARCVGRVPKVSVRVAKSARSDLLIKSD